ncbi:formate dehydrogenase subunit delta [Pararhizobium antarcticum]|uniref:Formate dehydrogenase n=1 Tax=Pararhizobium antarcticum TaxID=1798805 RepID=A0A657LTH0_9HYPH|nr:formate dehydrogenase subunit delta [Pararhizobium antarcticum]OJF96456.1 formate dehydrogenase [Pararhizobium antarcticum]OJF97995.1 formate dehydrogenase [Rhizobium sp. 58]
MSLDNTNGKLVRMANQIATFFKSQPEKDRVEGVATHINKFWEPRMRKAFFELVAQGDAGFDPIVIAAAAIIKPPYSVSEGVGTGSDAAAGAPGGKGTAAGESLSEPSIPEKA